MHDIQSALDGQSINTRVIFIEIYVGKIPTLYFDRDETGRGAAGRLLFSDTLSRVSTNAHTLLNGGGNRLKNYA